MYVSTRNTLFFFSTLALGAALHAQDMYRIQQIGDHNYSVTDLNDRRELVGSISGDGTVRGFVWRNGQITDIGDLEGGAAVYVEALGLNNRSTIVGVTMRSSDFAFRPIIREQSQMEDLGVFPDAFGVFAWDLNDRGEVIGDFEDGAFLLSNDQVTILESLPGGSGNPSPRAINDRGVVAGTSNSANGRRAVIWKQGLVRDLGVLEAATSSEGADINVRGQVVGTSSYPAFTRAFIWENGRMEKLPDLQPADDWRTSAASINDRGWVVGTANSSSNFQNRVALLWRDGAVYDLNDLLDAGDPLKPYVRVLNGRLINNRGQIVVAGVDSRAPNFTNIPYLLTPVGDEGDDDDDE